MSTPHSHVIGQPDYFSIAPTSYDHFSTESPCCSPALSPIEATAFPQHPLLARRQSIISTMPAASLLQLQTNAAHGSPSRPQHIQNVLHVTSDDSTTSDSSTSSTESSYSPEFARCSRCQRTSSVDYKTGKSNMISYGMNSYYCSRCAGMVGLIKR